MLECRLMKPTAELAARLDAILVALRAATDAARCTLRIDLAERGVHCNDVAAEALAPAVKSLRGQTSIDQRAAGSIRWLAEHHRPLVQRDLRGAVEPAPPPALMSVFGVTAQMLGPVVRGGMLAGWISVHYEKGPRAWTDADVKALETAIEQTQSELDDSRGAGRLAGKVALVTGGNTGIGRAVAITYADEGADVAIAWIAREPDARSLVTEVQRRGHGALAMRCDVTSEPDARAL